MIIKTFCIKEHDTLFDLFDQKWRHIYNLPINEEFRKINPDPNVLQIGSKIHIAVWGEIPKSNGASAFILTKGYMGDDICLTPLAKIFSDNGYKVYFYTNPIWDPLFSGADYISGIVRQISCQPGDIVVHPSFYNHDFEHYRNCSISQEFPVDIIDPKNFAGHSLSARSVAGIGLDPTCYDLNTHITIPESKFTIPKKSIGIAVGSTTTSVRSFHFRALNRLHDLCRRLGYKPTIICNKNDNKHENRNLFKCDFSNTENLKQCLSLVKDLDLLIVPNSGLMHVRQFTKKPMIVVMDTESSFCHAHNWIETYNGVDEMDSIISKGIFAKDTGFISSQFESKLIEKIRYLC